MNWHQFNLIKQEICKMTEPIKKRGYWKPGQSGNPAGRKPGTGEVAAIRACCTDPGAAVQENL